MQQYGEIRSRSVLELSGQRRVGGTIEISWELITVGHLLLVFHICGRPDAAGLSEQPPSPLLSPLPSGTTAARPIAAGWGSLS